MILPYTWTSLLNLDYIIQIPTNILVSSYVRVRIGCSTHYGCTTRFSRAI